MSDDIIIMGSFLFFMLLFAGVGLASMRVKEDTTDDYLVAGRGMHPALAALSAVSTWNSGYMFIGFISFVYLMGYSAIWIGIISTLGQIVAWIWLYKHIQHQAIEKEVRSLSSLIASTRGAPEAKLAAILSVAFLSIYAAAQLTAGGVALYSLLAWDKVIGILIGFVLVVAYCYAGGVRASIWTDAAQSVVMILGSTLLCLTALGEVGGFSGLHSTLTIINPETTGLFPYGLAFGVSLWIFAFFLGGLGVAGQPQVVSRVMTLGDDKDRKQAMIWFFVWQTPFIAIMFIIGLVSRALFYQGDFDPEMGLPMMALELLSPVWVGVILASIFAATMSTADSLVLACTAAITDDVKPEWSEDHKQTKRVTLAMAVLATSISLTALFTGNDSVFKLVVLAVYGLGSIFIPLLLLQMMGYTPDSTHSIIMMTSALAAVILWSVGGYAEDLFPSIPGIGTAFIAHFALCKWRNASSSHALGSLTLPRFERKQAVGIALATLVLITVVEGAYAAYASHQDDFAGGVGTYDIAYVTTDIEIDSGTIFVEDGGQTSIQILASRFDDVAFISSLVLTASWLPDDETTNGLGCAVNSGSEATDTVTTSFTSEQHEQLDNNNSGGSTELSIEMDWLNVLGVTLDDGSVVRIENRSETQIINAIEDFDDGKIDYDIGFELMVNVGTAGFGCNRDDQGNDITYTVFAKVLSFGEPTLTSEARED